MDKVESKERWMKTYGFIIGATLMMIFWAGAGVAIAQDQGIHFSARPAEKYKVSSITWEGHFGGRKEEPYNLYTLMNRGGFRAPTSKDYEDLIKAWLAKHPGADAIVVYTLDGALTISPDSKSKWVWVVDRDDNLNIHLVRLGGCEAWTMLLAKGDKAHVTRKEYESFAEKILEAESLAKRERLGIWSE
jgi:hypothetical protein